MELAGLGAIVAVTIRPALRTPSPAAHFEDVRLRDHHSRHVAMNFWKSLFGRNEAS